MVLLKGLLINLLFLLIFILSCNLVIWKKHKPLHLKEIQIFAISLALVILCLLLSVRVNEHFIYDLRFIPFLLGGLYGGKRVAIALAFFLIFIRIPLGGDGTWLTITMVIIALAIIINLSSQFISWPRNKKLMVTTLLSFGYSVIGYFLPSGIYGFFHITEFIIYTIVLCLSTFFVAYLLEILTTTIILELEAMKYEKMEIASHLAASISHEIRNPLTSVKGFLQLILEQKELKEEGKAYAALALEEVTRAAAIINDYLTFAKPYQCESALFDIEKEIFKCKEIIKPLAIKHNVEIQLSFSHSGKIQGETDKFRQVMLNICKNGIEAMPNGGTLKIHTSATHEKISIQITDTGQGMTPEQVNRLGEPYFSLKNQKGTGLGMMVVFRIVEGMKGSVKIQSKKHVGTTVSLTFPRI